MQFELIREFMNRAAIKGGAPAFVPSRPGGWRKSRQRSGDEPSNDENWGKLVSSL
jgi:hypothetical protein